MGMDRLSKRKFGIVCHGKVVRIPLEGDEILQVHGDRTQGDMKTLMNTKHEVHLKLELELLRNEELYAKVTYLRFIANFSKIVKPITSLTERDQKYEWAADGKKREHASRYAAWDLDQTNGKEWQMMEGNELKPRRSSCGWPLTIQYGIRGMILTAKSVAFKKTERSLVGKVKYGQRSCIRYFSTSGADKKYYNLGDMSWWP
ncbi:hypothetical protein Tco_0978784 [Tanacetum coccineum]|uniref:Uncharacterized protein n=1 Tax=Tanacetum coccineum TaxID=301880 RepID=A0ABQ5EPD7_9ASTR